MEDQMLSGDPRKHPAPVGKQGKQWHQVGLTAEWGKGGDGLGAWVPGEPLVGGCEHSVRRGRRGEQQLAERMAELGFQGGSGNCHLPRALPWPS